MSELDDHWWTHVPGLNEELVPPRLERLERDGVSHVVGEDAAVGSAGREDYSWR